MTQQLQGFYDADHNPVSRLTHIVGSGQSNKFQTVYLSSGGNSFVPLPSPYGKQLSAFPGWYGRWDNTTWTLTNASTTSPGVLEDASTATTQVVPSPMNQGCVSWGAVILSTTVKNSDNDGILDSWKTDPRGPGYCDAAFNNGVCNGPGDQAWIDLTGALHGQKDVFLQYDYMCSTVSKGSCAGGNYSFDPRLPLDTEASLSPPYPNAVDKVVAAYANSPGKIQLHAIAGNAIQESQSSCADTDVDANKNLTCPFPNEPGTVGFREGLAYIKNQVIDTQTGLLGCDPSTDGNCVAVFPHGKKDSYHYALFSHGVGLPNWFLSDGSLSSVKQLGNTVTFTTSLPHGINHIANDTKCALVRVTVVFAITNPNLEGTYCVLSPTPTTFPITVAGSPPTTTSTYPSFTI